MSDRPNNNAARHAFFYLTSFFALAISASAVGTLLFQIINYYFPQPEQYDFFSQGAIKFGLSSLIVAAPAFYAVTRVINRSLSHKDLDTDSGIRRWLTYIVMFIALAVSIGDLISVFYSFLNGELSVRFFLKALVIFLIAGGIFLYFFLDMRSDSEKERRQKLQVFSGVFWAAVLIPFIWTLFIMESPVVARQRSIDQQTISNLEGVRSAIDNYYQQNQQLPASVTELTTPQYYLPDMGWLNDHGFEYRATGARAFELCAEFQRDSSADDKSTTPYGFESSWEHPQGKHCFQLEAMRLTDAAAEKMNAESRRVPAVETTAVPGMVEPVPVF